MLIRIGYDIAFDVPAPAPMLLALYVHPGRAPLLQAPDRVNVEPRVPVDTYIDGFGNRIGRLLAPAGQIRLRSDNVIRDHGLPDEEGVQACQHPVHELPPAALPFLLASRYCEVDLLSDLAWNLFGNVPEGRPRVQAVCDWVQASVRFGYEHARPARTAAQVLEERVGVCRDFQHLAIAFCRALNIPARYATGYLGDIGIPAQPYPMDFSAWFEVYLGGRWYTLDARHNTPRIGRVLMAVGRDAADVALTTSFGPTILRNFQVWTDEVGNRQEEDGREDEAPLTAAAVAVR